MAAWAKVVAHALISVLWAPLLRAVSQGLAKVLHPKK